MFSLGFSAGRGGAATHNQAPPESPQDQPTCALDNEYPPSQNRVAPEEPSSARTYPGSQTRNHLVQHRYRRRAQAKSHTAS